MANSVSALPEPPSSENAVVERYSVLGGQWGSWLPTTGVIDDDDSPIKPAVKMLLRDLERMEIQKAHIYNPPVARGYLLMLLLKHAIEDLENESTPELQKAVIRGNIDKLWLAQASKKSIVDERCHALAVAIERASTDPATNEWIGDLNERMERAVLYFYQDRFDAIPAADEKPGFLGGLFADAIDARRASIRGEADGPVNSTFATLCEAITGHRLTPASARKIRQNARKEELARKAGG